MRTIEKVKKEKNFSFAIKANKMKLSFKKQLSKDLALCKCYVMATGENRNDFVFLQEDIDSCVDSIYYKPVVGRIHVTEEGQLYMGEHDVEVTKEGEEISLTIPFGVVTDTPATYEEVEEKDGTIATYLVVEIILWVGRYPELFETIYSDEIWFNQSMEITINAFSPWSENKNYRHVTDFTFEALCLLGKSDDPEFNTEPCFPSAVIKPFHLNDTKISSEQADEVFKADFALLIEEVKVAFEKNKDESEIEDMSNEPKDNGTTPVGNNNPTSTETNFALSLNKMSEKLRKCIKTKCSSDYVYVLNTFSDYCYYCEEVYCNGSYSNKFYKQEYSVNNDEVELSGEPIEVFSKFVTAEEQEQIDSARGDTEVFSLDDKKKLEDEVAAFKLEKETLEQKVNELEGEKKELEQFKLDVIDNKIKAEKEAVFSTWKTRVKEETFKAIEKISIDLTAEEITAKFKLAFADEKLSEEESKAEDKANFSAAKGNNTVSFSFEQHKDSPEDKPYNGIFDDFGKKDKEEK